MAQEIELSYTFGNFGYNMRTFVSAAVFYKQYWACIQKASSILSHTFDQLQFTKNNIVLRHRIEYVFLKCTIKKWTIQKTKEFHQYQTFAFIFRPKNVR